MTRRQPAARPTSRAALRFIAVVGSLAMFAAACSDSADSIQSGDSSPDSGSVDESAPSPTLPPVTSRAPTTEPLTTEPLTTEPASTEPPTTEPVTTTPPIVRPALGDPAGVGRTPMVELIGRLPASLLDALPADDPFLNVSLGDYAAVSKLVGLEQPDAMDLTASQEWLIELYNSGLIIGFPGFALINVSQLQEFEDELGFSLVDVQDFANVSGRVQFTVLGGDLTLSADLTDLGNGIVSAGTGDDFFNSRDQATAARPNGVPLRLATADGLVAGARSTPLVESWIAGDSGSLLVVPAVAAVAATLDTADVVGADVFLSDFTFLPRSDDDPLPNPTDPPLSVPFDALGVGVTALDGHLAGAFVYAFADEPGAAAAVAEIDDRWRADPILPSGQLLSNLFELSSVEQVGSTVLVMGIAGESAGRRFPLDLLFDAEPLFTHT